jgi:hypothetical protein
MEQAAEKIQQEYWRPAVQNNRTQEIPRDVRTRVEVCDNCGTEFVVGSQFCHVCGGERQAVQNTSRWTEILDFGNIRQALGLSTGALVAFIVGVVCILAAVMTGFIYSANTLVDWQAVQTWRIEWMLAAAVAFIAGILLNKQQ